VAAFGSGAMTNSIADLRDEAQAFFVIGSNTTEQHPIIGNAIKHAVRKRGAKLIVADPREIELASFADIYLQHAPGSDIALLNAMAHVILSEGLADAAFIQERTENFEAWSQVIQHYTPHYASKITGVPAEDIVAAAGLFASHRPGAILYAMGITQHTMGHQNVLAVANLGMILGNVGLPGSGVNPLRGQNNVQGACDMGGLPNVFSGYQIVTDPAIREKMAKAWNVPVAAMDATVGLTITEMLAAAESGDVRALWIMGENPVMSDPDSNHARHCLESVEFLVTQDIFLNETAELADVVLPATCFAEKDGTFTNTERRVQRVRKAVEPPGEALPDWQIICEIARRTEQALGVNSSAGWQYAGPHAIMQEIAALTPICSGISYERLDSGSLQWPCPTPDHPGTQVLHREKFSRGRGYLTPVHHQPADEEPDDEYPLLLTTGRRLQHFHTGTMTRRVGGLDYLLPYEVLEIHPDDASALGIADGEWVTVESRRGCVRVNAWVTDRIRPGVVFLTFHFAEALGNVLTNSAVDPIAKIPEYKVCGVRVLAEEPVSAD
jgi:formate dehydrogenase alpha subunit